MSVESSQTKKRLTIPTEIYRWTQHRISDLSVTLLNCRTQDQYKPLASSASIRIIKIAPKLVGGKYIGCIVHDSSRLPPGTGYQALSYLWGDPAPSRHIGFKDGDTPGAQWRLHMVHENLWRFLDHLWRNQIFHRFFWTDRLCLNQYDPTEMAQQIPRMGSIFSEAGSVMIWLALSAEDEEQLQSLRETTNEVIAIYANRPSKQPQQLRSAISSIVGNDYWKRMWITQEVAMARTVLVEMQRIPSFTFVELHSTLLFFRGPRHINDLADLRNGREPMQLQSSSLLIKKHAQRTCTRPHDRVYGLLGMLESDDPLHSIDINYDKPASDVLIDALFTMSSVKYYEFVEAINVLMKEGLLEDPNSLEEYRDRNRTSTRDRAFAGTALKVFDALNLIMACYRELPTSQECEGAIEHILGQFAWHYHRSDNLLWKAMTGIVLVLGAENANWRHMEWRRLRLSKLIGHSPWLCKEHASPVPKLRSISWIHASGKYPTLGRRRLKDVIETCAKYRQHGRECNGSSMIFTIPDIGFRLEVHFGRKTIEVWLDSETADKPEPDVGSIIRTEN